MYDKEQWLLMDTSSDFSPVRNGEVFVKIKNKQKYTHTDTTETGRKRH